jgi:putative transposase
MASLRKAYRFRLRPTRVQEQAMLRIAGARRFVWNWALERRKAYYAEHGRGISAAQLSKELTALRQTPETAWLAEIPRECLQQALRDLDKAFRNFFENRVRYPRFRSRKRCQPTFRFHIRIRLAGDTLTVPGTGRVRLRLSQPVYEKITGATVKRDASGRWFVTLAVKFEMPDVALPPPDPAKVIGIDLGLKEYAVLSDGTCIPAPKFYRAAERKLARAQRVVSRRKMGSRGRAKAKAVVARIHRKTADRRADFLHKLSTKLIRGYDGLCIEDLCVKGLARSKLSKAFADASMGEFIRQLTYKAQWHRKHLAVVSRWFPSSRLCGACGEINATLMLDDRSWACGCGMIHDRDLNAAVNIRDEGLRLLAAGDADRLNDGGADVSPSYRGQLAVKP